MHIFHILPNISSFGSVQSLVQMNDMFRPLELL